MRVMWIVVLSTALAGCASKLIGHHTIIRVACRVSGYTCQQLALEAQA